MKCPTCKHPIKKGIFFADRVMIVDGQTVELSPMQVKIAKALHKHAPKTRSVRQIMLDIYDREDDFTTKKCIDVQIYKMRERFVDALGHEHKLLIWTDYGKGYRMQPGKEL